MAPDIANLTQNIQSKLSSYVPNDEKLRKTLLESTWSLLHALETPIERLARTLYVEPALFASTRTLVDLKVFNTLASSSQSQTAIQLAEAAGADPKLLERLLKLAAVQDFVHEIGPDEYVASGITKLLATDGPSGAFVDLTAPFRSYGSLPEFLKDQKYQNPTSKDNTAFKKALNTDKHFFDWTFSPGNEYCARGFENHMKWKTFSGRWFDVQPLIDEVFGAGVKDDEVLMVDVGGSTGYDLTIFKEAYPDLPGRLIVQDVPSTIESLDHAALKAKAVEAMQHDFFTPEPVKGAKAYYLKAILHDWPDEQCRQILSNLKPALRSGYSRILVNDIVVPDVGANWWETSLDMLMMTVHGSYERRERDFKALVESVGLKVRKVWTVEGAHEKVVEIELAD